MSKNASITPEDATDALARRLYWKMEHLDPSNEPPWDALSEREKEYYRLLVADLLIDRRLLYAALGGVETPIGKTFEWAAR